MASKPPFFEEFGDWLKRTHPKEAHLPDLLTLLQHQLEEVTMVDKVKEVAMKLKSNPASKFYSKEASMLLRRFMLGLLSRGRLN